MFHEDKLALDSEIREKYQRLNDGFGSKNRQRRERGKTPDQKIRDRTGKESEGGILGECFNDLFPGAEYQSLDDEIIEDHRYQPGTCLRGKKVRAERVGRINTV